ncbi:stonustoxin subunit beta-like [Denticeps clupeoides]|uniref:stonustoxin subunit beta-like n=1 Tax=Denticeps clupeoides TaxID=299321 RepID=UPI0010A332D5|nr:stonustoxin subunit beta-like [Denticeps clupeoides]
MARCSIMLGKASFFTGLFLDGWVKLLGTSVLFLPPSDSCQFTLDPNTVNKNLHLSEEDRRVTWRPQEQPYPDHPERFDVCQVLCREGVSGRCYWEVEWSGDWVSISASYRTISRKVGSKACWFGSNDQSWSLVCSTSSPSFLHTPSPPDSISSRIGVYVDHSAGTLSTMTLLHRVQTTFTQPLHPGFRLYIKSSLKLL